MIRSRSGFTRTGLCTKIGWIHPRSASYPIWKLSRDCPDRSNPLRNKTLINRLVQIVVVTVVVVAGATTIVICVNRSWIPCVGLPEAVVVAEIEDKIVPPIATANVVVAMDTTVRVPVMKGIGTGIKTNNNNDNVVEEQAVSLKTTIGRWKMLTVNGDVPATVTTMMIEIIEAVLVDEEEEAHKIVSNSDEAEEEKQTIALMQAFVVIMIGTDTETVRVNNATIEVDATTTTTITEEAIVETTALRLAVVDDTIGLRLVEVDDTIASRIEVEADTIGSKIVTVVVVVVSLVGAMVDGTGIVVRVAKGLQLLTVRVIGVPL